MKCLKCGHENDVDTQYCEKCGSDLKRGVSRLENSSNDGLKLSSPVFIVAFVILVAGLGLVLTSGTLLQMNTGAAAANIPTVYAQSSEIVTNQPTWHQIATYTEPDRGVMNFNIQGQKFKVVMSATPPLDNQLNILNVDLLKDNSALTNGLISWNPTESITTKERTIEAFTGPGNYQVNIYVTKLKNWKVTVYDYY
ncbi:zinc ribbon domain-containing protein [Methanobacterium paludis]|uniref:Zinc-ribbon domain-containing protein n=1 Tax=Methanobacterium paludis (strain DSM 25820 / JCM 18151 / SWAN1) TaxID=868131 RepID=F6D3I9_METPW|nr:zinc ribbon domain-containing protein [Methanobacterium paludis]AEG19165.1 hypothetical protein MSWAN_2157 [Methanobacterium paludis]